MPTKPELRFFNTGEVAIHYADWPADTGSRSPAYLFLHGITGRHETWYGTVDEIRRGARGIAVDLRGHGRSGHTAGAYRLPDYARDVEALLDHLLLGPVVAIGHSLGGVIALQLAATRPELTGALVLEDPPLFAREFMDRLYPDRRELFTRQSRLSGSGLSLEQMVAQLRADIPDASEDAIQALALSLFVTDSDAISHVRYGRLDWTADIESIMQSVQCPVLLMQGKLELGGWLRDEDGLRTEELIPDCELSVWEDTGHSLHHADSERFTRQVNKFSSRVGAVAAQ